MELNLVILPRVASRRPDETGSSALDEFEAYWESEFPRLGEKAVAVGFAAWDRMGRPEDGWQVGKGVTGHMCFEMDVAATSVSEPVHEPSAEEYIHRSERCVSQLNRLCPGCTNSTSSAISSGSSGCEEGELDGGGQGNKSTKDSSEPQIENVLVSEWTEASAAAATAATAQEVDGSGNGSGNGGPSLSSRKRLRAADFFSTEGPSPIENRANDDGNTESAVMASDDGLVYSRIHGYRIKMDEGRDTSIAYKKVLGDINVSSQSLSVIDLT